MTDTVHVEIPHAANHALFEGAVDWRACSAVAVECAIACCEGRVPDPANAKRIWARMIATGHVTRDPQGHVTGATLADCKWALEDQGYTTLDFIDYRDQPDLEGAIHPLLKSAALAQRPVIGIYTNGQALPNNERGVGGHFTNTAGLDSTAGYLIQNGDTQTAIANQTRYRQWPACTQVPTNWATWATLKAAGLAGVIAVHPKASLTPPAPAPAPVAPSQAAQVAALAEQVATLAEQLANAVKAL